VIDVTDASELAVSYKTQEKALLVNWRLNYRSGKPVIHISESRKITSKLERKIKAVYPRGKIGREIRETLTYHTI
jgi:hypothetical protein